jgi:hypothetical protein
MNNASIVLKNEYNISGDKYYFIPISGFVLNNATEALETNNRVRYNLELSRVN